MYNKLFARILDSSIWLEPPTTRIVWITLLAAMDQDGFAHFAALDNLAARARVTIDEAVRAVECFLAPDLNSSNPANEGRRIERVPGGYLILNATEARATYNRLIQREQTRARVAKHRAKTTHVTKSVTESLHALPERPEAEAISEAHSNSKTESEQRAPSTARFEVPTLEMVKLAGEKCGLPESEAEKFFNFYSSKGWLVGKSKMRSMPHAIAGWRNRWQERNNGNQKPNDRTSQSSNGGNRGITDYSKGF